MNTINTPERSKKRRTKNGLMLKFGINYDQYEAMLLEHGNVCAICGNTNKFDRQLAVDHCHSTGKVRGMLCTKCNTAIGLFGDNVEIVKKAVEYLQRDYNLPALECSLGKIHRDDAKGWKLLIKTPDGIFPSAMHAGDHYKVNATTIRAWCLENSKYKKDGFSCEKLFLSLNEMKERINDVRN